MNDQSKQVQFLCAEFHSVFRKMSAKAVGNRSDGEIFKNYLFGFKYDLFLPDRSPKYKSLGKNSKLTFLNTLWWNHVVRKSSRKQKPLQKQIRFLFQCLMLSFTYSQLAQIYFFQLQKLKFRIDPLQSPPSACSLNPMKFSIKPKPINISKRKGKLKRSRTRASFSLNLQYLASTHSTHAPSHDQIKNFNNSLFKKKFPTNNRPKSHYQRTQERKREREEHIMIACVVF